MKKFTSLLISVSLVLAGVAFAQQPEEQATPGAGKKGAEKTHVEKAAKPEATAKQTGAMKEQGVTGAEQGTGKGHKAKAEKSASATETGAAPVTEPASAKGRKAKTIEKSATATGATGATGAQTNVSAQPT